MQKHSRKNAKASSATPLRAIFASLSIRTAAPAVAEQKYLAYTCANCSSHFAMNQLVIAGEAEGENAVSPICPDCGSDEVSASTDEEFDFEQLDDESTSAVACSTCATQLIFSDETKAGLNGAINCTVCGTANPFNDEEEEIVQDFVDTTDDEDDDGDIDLDDVELELDDDDDAFAGTDEGIEDETNPHLEGEGEPVEEATDVSLDLEGAPGTDEVQADDLEDLDLVDAIESEGDDEIAAKFLRVGDTVMAQLGTHTVGYQNREDVVASRQEVFQSPEYLQALANSVRVKGMSDTLNTFGFKRNSIKVNASRIQALSEARVAERAEAVASVQNENFVKDVQACMGIAAVGINKGFWPSEAAANPLKLSLASALTQLGIRNPTRIIDQAFASSSDAYHRLLADKANDLLKETPAVRNSLATAIAGMAYASGAIVASVDDEDEVSATAGETIATAARRPVRVAHVASETTEAPTVRSAGVHAVAESIRQQNGGRVF